MSISGGDFGAGRIKIRGLNCAIQNIARTIKKMETNIKVGQRERHLFLRMPMDLTLGLLFVWVCEKLTLILTLKDVLCNSSFPNQILANC